MYNNYYKNYHKKNKYEQNIWFKWILPSIGVVVLICVFLIASGHIKLRKIFIKKEESQSTEVLEPYLEYKDKEGNIIREYKFFAGTEPKAKDINGKTNFFLRSDFEAKMKKHGLTMFPVMWIEGKEHLNDSEYENGEVKQKHEWKVSKANYQLIQTNKPNNTTKMLAKDVKGANNFYNKSDCFLNTINNIDINNILSNREYKYETPYIRFMTKNLKV